MIILVYLLQIAILVAWVVLLARVVMSWVDPRQARPISRTLTRITEPVLAPIRNALPRTGQLDLAPLVVLLGLFVLMRIAAAL